MSTQVAPTIDLRSDTLSVPSADMVRAMAEAPVGDDCYGEDTSVHSLEAYCASLFGKEQALFMPSGTMCNQIAIRTHTSPGDSVVTHARYHVNFFEAAASADLSHVSLLPISDDSPFLTPAAFLEALDTRAAGVAYSAATLLCLENTVSGTGGRVAPLHNIAELSTIARSLGMRVHLDGARIFHAAAASGALLSEYGACADTISACFSKGIGAPFGSVLCGSSETIAAARKYRKWFGGALHQSGYLARAAEFGLRTNMERLGRTHALAKTFAHALASFENFFRIDPQTVETNMVMFSVDQLNVTAQEFCKAARQRGVLFFPWTSRMVRATFHLGHSESDVRIAVARLAELLDFYVGQTEHVYEAPR